MIEVGDLVRITCTYAPNLMGIVIATNKTHSRVKVFDERASRPNNYHNSSLEKK